MEPEEWKMEHKEWGEEEKVPNEKEEEPEEDALKKSVFVLFCKRCNI
jgi:predicted Holliday junction resolvase-like endonuclease